MVALKKRCRELETENARLRQAAMDALTLLNERDQRIAQLEAELERYHRALDVQAARRAKRMEREIKIRELAENGCSINEISRRVYGYSGGKAYQLVRQALNTTRVLPAGANS